MDKGEITMEQNLIDPCTFQVVLNGQDVVGVLQFHVDDLLLWADDQFHSELQAALSEAFPISERDPTNFTYVGSDYEITENEYVIKQTSYLHERLEAKSRRAPTRSWLARRHFTAIGCLGLQRKRDLIFHAQPTWRRAGRRLPRWETHAKEHADKGIKMMSICLEMCLVVYHDAAWANADLGQNDAEESIGH